MLAFLKQCIDLPKSPMRLIASWFFSCTLFEIMREKTLLSNGIFLLIWLGLFVLFTALQHWLALPRFSAALLAVGALTYALTVTAFYLTVENYPLLIVLLAAVAIVLFPLLRKETGRLLPFSVSDRTCRTIVITVGVLSAGMIATITCLRYLTFSAPNYDFGIFCNMFHNMSESGLPLVSCERNELLSHFAVHISPIYYLILPFYWLFPSPLTLQIAQAVIVASGLIPLYRLARHFNLTPAVTTVLCALYAVYPPISTGCFYDLHENCFLLPLLLWVFALYEEKRYGWMLLPACLVLFTKEDAAVYLAFFALYLVFSRRDLKRGLSLGAAAAVYFTAAILLLQTFGDGAMFGRYTALLTPEKETGDLLSTLLRDPAFFLRQIANERTASQKLLWLFEMLLPFGLLLWTHRGKYSRLWLLAPLLVNLLTQYPYQFNIRFQYSFGTIAFLFYLLIQNAADASPQTRRNHLIFATVAATMMYVVTVVPHFNYYTSLYRENQETYARMEELLDTIPDDASVIASSVLIPHLAERTHIYEDVYHPTPDAEYIVVDLRPYPHYTGYREIAVDYGYRIHTYEEDLLVIFQSPT